MPWLIIGVIILVFVKGDTMISNNDTKYDDLFKKYANISGLDWKMVKSICYIESNLGRAASVAHGLIAPNDVEGSKSSDGKSWGLMQMTLPTARDYDPAATAQKLNNAEYSVRLACQHIKRLFNYYGGETEWIVKAYNQGQGRTNDEIDGTRVSAAGAYYAKYLQYRGELV